MELWDIIIALAGGLLAGFINTLAGSGSAITLTILTTMLGLNGNMANATNRVGILVLSASSIVAFQRQRMIDWTSHREEIITGFTGALLGLWAALESTPEQFMSVFKYLLLLLLLLILVKPKRWLYPKEFTYRMPRLLRWLIMLALGFYGGYIQMGMGMFFLAFAILGLHMNFMRANALKMVVVGSYTLVVLLIFWWNGWIHWEYGLLLALGQGVGGWFTAHYFSKWKGADKFAYYLLIAVVAAALLRLFFNFEL